jgi:hypothetical protein
MDVQGLELFTGRTRRRPDELSVTVQRGGRFVVHDDIAKLMGDPSTVELLFDRVKGQMAIRPATPESVFAYPLRRRRDAAIRLISGRKFMGHYGISHEATRRYKATWNGAMLLVDLTQPLGADPAQPGAPSGSDQESADARRSHAG